MANSNEYMSKYMSERYKRRRAAALEQLGGKCAICGSTDELEIDHKDPKQKSFSIGKALAGGSEQKIQAELAKCQLLCKKHHQEKSLAESGKKKAECGTLSGYRYCRCERCKEAKRMHDKNYKKKRRQRLKSQGAVA